MVMYIFQFCYSSVLPLLFLVLAISEHILESACGCSEKLPAVVFIGITSSLCICAVQDGKHLPHVANEYLK